MPFPLLEPTSVILPMSSVNCHPHDTIFQKFWGLQVWQKQTNLEKTKNKKTYEKKCGSFGGPNSGKRKEQRNNKTKTKPKEATKGPSLPLPSRHPLESALAQQLRLGLAQLGSRTRRAGRRRHCPPGVRSPTRSASSQLVNRYRLWEDWDGRAGDSCSSRKILNQNGFWSKRNTLHEEGLKSVGP